MVVSRFSSAALIRMCGKESIVVSMDIGNLMALDAAALRKERLTQTPDNEAAKEFVRPHRCGGTHHGDLRIRKPRARAAMARRSG
jgi:hypothetical protein